MAARRTALGGRAADLTFTLAWDSIADLHLEVTCPTGQRLWYGARSLCGGNLDVGGNHTPATARTDPIENIYFTDGPPGRYLVRVHYYNPQGAGPSQPFRLLVERRGGQQEFSGVLSGKDDEWTTTINYARLP
ncbi:MAG: hypothetical protein ACP5EN_13590 [Rhodovulum sp.]